MEVPTLYRFKKPAIAIIIFIFVIILADSISRAAYAGVPFLTTISPLIFALLTLCIALFYIIVGAKLLKKIRGSQVGALSGLSKRKKNLKRVGKFYLRISRDLRSQYSY